MTDDTDDTSEEEQATDEEAEDAPVTFEEMMEFGTERVEDEVSGFEGEVPNHAAELLTARATDLLQTISNIEMRRAHEEADDPEDEEVQAAIEEDIVDILLAVSAVKFEYDLDIADAFEHRMEFVRDFQAMQEAMQDAETPEEVQEAIEEHMGDPEEADGPMPMPMNAMQMGGAADIEPGDNVDNEDYDPEDPDRGIA